MNKVVCNLCGTSYPENAAQCPICGYARSAEVPSDRAGETKYTYVKGGRFSKANVKKRNQAALTSSDNSVFTENKRSENGSKSKVSLIIIVVVLLLAIIAVVGYIALRFFLPNNFIFEGLDNLKLPTSAIEQEETPSDPVDEIAVESTDDVEETEPDLSCTAVSLVETEINFDAIGAKEQIAVQLTPSNTTDSVKYSSSDTSIATVSNTGLVTSVSEGTAVITVVCGEVSADCIVVCAVPTEEQDTVELTLNRKEITFDIEGQSWLLYDGEIPVSDIIWTSDDDTVATIADGKVIAVGNGDTTVSGVYGDVTVSCVIHCKFDDETTSETGGISEAGGETKRTYKLYNPTGYADDVTIQVDSKFTLMLVDEDKNEITDAEWSVKNKKVCSYKDGIVTGLKSGTTEVTATYEGVTYTCIVRVN